MPRFKLTIEYTGTRYSGWQIQKNARTVQGELDRAIREVSVAAALRALRLRANRCRRARARAGRAPRALHAARRRSSCAGASTTSCPPTSTSATVDKAPHRFHARHDAVSRSYLYQISRRRTAFAKPFVWWIREPLDLEAMRRRAAAFSGHAGLPRRSPTTTRPKSPRWCSWRAWSWPSRDPDPHPDSRDRTFSGRWCGGWSVCVAAAGRGEIRAERVTDPDVDVAALTAPAAGLFLEGVYYEGDSGPGPIRPVLNMD